MTRYLKVAVDDPVVMQEAYAAYDVHGNILPVPIPAHLLTHRPRKRTPQIPSLHQLQDLLRQESSYLHNFLPTCLYQFLASLSCSLLVIHMLVTYT